MSGARLHLEGQHLRPLPEFGTQSGPVLTGWLPFQSSNLEKAPWCFYPEDYGYRVTASQETPGGMTADITRNKKYGSSGRPNSPDIDTLRVQIQYHTSHMLQFKVSALTLSWSLPHSMLPLLKPLLHM